MSEVLAFTRRFSLLQDAGLPVLRSLRVLRDDTPVGALRTALTGIIDNVEAGSTLSAAFGQHPEIINQVYLHMLRVGEAVGALEAMLQCLVSHLDLEVKISTMLGLIPGSWDLAPGDDPVLWPIVSHAELARTARMLAVMVTTGTPILEALALVRDACWLDAYRTLYQGVFETIRAGDLIAHRLRQSEFIPRMVVSMVEVAEETGNLDDMLNRIADFYQAEVERALKFLNL